MGLRQNERSQSIQIGAVLFFGALVIVFSIYQAFVIPSQNRGVEFNHNQRVQGDMVEVRNALLETKTTGEDGYVSVELGTSFPARLFALNPAPPSGSLFSTEERPIVIEEDGTDITDDVCPGTEHQTRFLEYRPTYSEYQEAGTLRYENTVLYHDFGDDVFMLTEQTLVSDDSLLVVPITGSYSEGGGQTVAIEPIAGRVDTSQKQDLTVTLPTELSEEDWEDLLSGEVDASDISVTSGATSNLILDLDGEYRIDCGPVGLGEVPPSGARGGDDDEINPAAPGDVKLVNEIRNNNEITLEFNNTGGTNNLTEGRINFYDGQGSAPTEAAIRGVGEPNSATLPIRGPYQTFDPNIEIDGEGAITQVVLDFDKNVNPNDWFVISLQLETGEIATYFVPAG